MHGSDEDPVALAQIHAQIETMEAQHQAKLSQIKRQQVLEEQKNRLSMYSSVEGGMQRIIAGTLNGTIKLNNIFQQSMQMIFGAVVDMLAKTAAQWMMDAVMKKALGTATAEGQIGANAAAAGSAAFASIAAIPIVGPALAPEAAAVAYTGAMAFAPMASFAVGSWDLPRDMIAQVHQGETILPKTFAEDFRNNGGSLGGGGGHTVHYHDNSGKLSPSEIRRNAKLIQDTLKDLQRKQ